MLLVHWHALVAGATVLTLLWGWMARETNVYVSGTLAALLWGIASLTATNLTRVTMSGTEINADAPTLQLVFAALAILSALVPVMYHQGLYPPPAEAGESTSDFTNE